MNTGLKKLSLRYCVMHLGCVAMLLHVGGCGVFRKQPPKVLASPSAKATVSEFSGTALSGPLARSIDVSAMGDPWTVDCRIVGVRTLPTEQFQSVGPLARLIVSDAGGELMAPSSRLVYSTSLRRFESDSGTINFARPVDQVAMGQLSGAVAGGSTVAFDLAATQTGKTPTRRRLTVSVFRTEKVDEYQLAVAAVDLSAVQHATAAGAVPLPPKEVHELIVMRQHASGSTDHIALTLPMRFPPTAVEGVVIDLMINTKLADATGTAKRLEQELEARAAAVAGSLAEQASSADDLNLNAALTAFVDSGEHPRAALAYLTAQSNALLTQSVVLVGDDQLLTLLGQNIRTAIPRLSTRDRVNVAWMLDVATIKTVASIKDDETNRSLPAVHGALESYAGEAGRQLDVLQSLANQSHSSAELNNRIVAEQLIDLEDDSPAIRVRAYDWLNGRKLAPPDYDPLAPAKARRATLEQYHDTAATQATK